MNNLYSKMNNFIFFLINYFIDFLIYLKYFAYFNLFLSSLTTNLIYYKTTNNINSKLIKSLYYSINLNGCVLIKFVQWVIINIELLEDDSNQYILKMFKKFYENCSIHNLNYTKKMFYKDFGYNFDELLIIDKNFSVKSGSIAQVYKVKLNASSIKNELNFLENEKSYALKVIHPEVYYQLFFPITFIYIYKFLVSNISFLKKYDTIFDFDSFFTNLKLQLNMNNEYKNMQYFYKTYIDNPYIVIPEPIVSNDNCLLMEYVEGEFMHNLDISDFEKQKICVLFNLFNKDCFFFNEYFHSDLHDSNWKIKKYNDFYQIVVYDFGYIIKNDIQELSKKTIINFDLNNLEGIGESIYDSCVCHTNLNKEFIVNSYKKFMTKTVPYTDDYLIKTYQFCYNNNLILKPAFLELFICNILLKKYFQKYLFKQNSDQYDSNFLISLNINYIHTCKKYNIFKKVQTYIENSYLNNQTLLDTYVYEDNYLENIENKNIDNEINI
jgi:predicted unusual protein kinase regulating ubiquinone biosynthesis (AarF/ABC1/UbiB family)